jgi:hypothetical protein
MARARAGGLGHERRGVGRWQPRDGCARSRTGEEGEERERRERGRLAGWAGPRSGSHLSAKERERGREWQVGPGLRLNIFILVQKCSNLIRPKTDILKLQKFEIKYGFEGLDESNNFIHRNFSRFEMNFKLKFRESNV